VRAAAPPAADSFTPSTLVDRSMIRSTPGADRSNSLAMITDYVPGAYLVHDQLHVRGGHQVTWEIDGVEIPNTNIASNLGPLIDPGDIDYLQIQRGGYGAAEGDRTYGVFNVVPRTGFERSAQADLTLSGGNDGQTNDSLSIGSHTDRFAYYASLRGNRSDLGLMTPAAPVLHDAEDGVGGVGARRAAPTPDAPRRRGGSRRCSRTRPRTTSCASSCRRGATTTRSRTCPARSRATCNGKRTRSRSSPGFAV
jgi:hypothetical protein